MRRFTVSLGVSIVAVACFSLGLSGCTAVRNGLGTRDGTCFSTLPAGRRVAGKAAVFGGVRFLSPEALLTSMTRASKEHFALPSNLVHVRRKSECLVAYREEVPAAVVARAWHPRPGPYRFLIVIVERDDNRVLGIVALPRSPLRFAHLS